MVRRAFGTFNAAIEAAGYTPLRPAPSRIRTPLVGGEEVLRAFQAWTARYGEPPTMADWDPYRARRLGQGWRVERYRQGDWPSARTVCKHFGNFTAAAKAAGLSPRRQGGIPWSVKAAQERNRTNLLEQRLADRAGVARQLLAARVAAVARARNAGDTVVLRASLIQLASTALNWADDLDDHHT